jgi:hypothetical protein
MRLTAQDEKRPSYHSVRHDAHYTTSSSFSNQSSKKRGFYNQLSPAMFREYLTLLPSLSFGLWRSRSGLWKSKGSLN